MTYQGSTLRSRSGFTLVEITVVILLLGILFGFVVSHYNDLQTESKRKVIDTGIAEYNAREKQLWAKYRLGDEKTDSDSSFDRNIYDNMDHYLDPGHSYDSAGSVGEEGENWYYNHLSYGNANSGTSYTGYLEFQGVRAYVRRAPATLDQPAHWWVHSYQE